MMQDRLSDITYGLVGRGIGHSRSAEFLNAIFAREGTAEKYANFDLPTLTPAALYTLVLMNPRLRGFNVTAPYKEEIMQYLDSVSALARRTGAVNTVRVERAPDGRVTALHGYNTDVEGFTDSVQGLAAQLQKGHGALILGTGGASKAVAVALSDMDIPFVKVSRAGRGDSTVSYDDIDATMLADYPLIVNATPLGMWPDTGSLPALPYHLIGIKNMCHDLVYNPSETAFMKACAEGGAQVKNGLDMLHAQAIKSLNIWRK